MVAVTLYDQLGPASKKLREKAKNGVKSLSASEVAGWDQPTIQSALENSRKGNVKSLGDFTKYASEKEAPAPKLVQSRIRVWLSRPLTWAEKEAIETNHDDIHSRRINDTNLDYKFRVSDDKEYIWVDASFGSRLSFDLVAAVLEQHLVNVYPKAVRTFREYNGE